MYLLRPRPFFFHQQNTSSIFPPSSGGAEKMAMDMGVRYLGAIELDPKLGQLCDSGQSFIDEFPDSRVSKEYQQIVQSKFMLYL